ncbi:MAG: MoxR family ATPase [Myxococcota bacterium]
MTTDATTGPATPTAGADTRAVQDAFARVREAVGRVIVGQDEPVRLAFATLLCEGHALFEGVPGVAKTLLVRTLANALALRFGRVQFTADLMPADVIGTSVLQQAAGDLRFRPGPLFTDVLLADEINRAPAKTQAALLEAMQERAATVDGVRHDLGPYFTVFATQNPVEQEGTYPLPEAELDRFLFKVVVGYPGEDEEVALLARHHAGGAGGGAAEAAVAPVLDAGELARLRDAVRRVIVRDEVLRYVADLVRATRDDARFELGASPRAGVLLLRAAKANAALEGRDFAIPEDVQQVHLPTLRHRVLLDAAAEVDGTTPDEALRANLSSVTVPR